MSSFKKRLIRLLSLLKKTETISLISLILSVFALFYTGSQYNFFLKEFNSDYRPYLTLNDTLIDNSEYAQKLKKLLDSGKGNLPEENYKFSVMLQNVGKLPARFAVAKKNLGFPGVLWEK